MVENPQKVNESNYKIIHLDSVDSTNEYLKRNANNLAENTVVIAHNQTKGKGRLSRSFESKDGGLYMSVLLKPSKSAKDSLFITTAAAVAVAKAIESQSGKLTKIKWVNDVYIDNKKVSGILAESKIDSSTNSLEYIVLGIGVNLYQDTFSKEIEDIAGNVFSNPVTEEQKQDMATNILDNLYTCLCGTPFMDEYKSRSNVVGREVLVIKPTGQQKAKAIEIDDEASLVVEYENGEREKLFYGEISLKL